MLRDRAQSQYGPARHHKKQHCPEDKTCKQCCICVETLRKQNKILMDKNISWSKERVELEKVIMNLNRELKQWKKKQKQFEDIEQFKRKLREQIRGEAEDKHKIDDMIIKQKYAHTKQERDSLLKQKDQLQLEIIKWQKQKQRQEQLMSEQKQAYRKLEKECEQKKNQIIKYKANVLQIANKNAGYEDIIKDKSEVICRLEKVLNMSEKNYLDQKSKSAENQFQLLQSQQEIKANIQKLNELKKHAQSKNASIQNLTKQKSKLDNLVKELQKTICSYTVLSDELRHRIFVSEDYALQKEIQVKKLEADYYDSLYQRSL